MTTSIAHRGLAAVVIAIAVLLSGLLAGAASARPTAPASADAGFKYRMFKTPSGNIECVMYKSGGRWGMRCDVFEHDWTAPPKHCEEGDAGSSVGMGGKARPRFICVSDAIGAEKVLQYGKTKSYGPFTCKSKRSGLKCWNKLGRGWKLSRESYRFWY